MATAVHGRVSQFLRWPFRVLGHDKDLTGQSPLPEKRRYRKTEARERVPTDLISAICYWLLHSRLWRECRPIGSRSVACERTTKNHTDAITAAEIRLR